MGVIDGITTRLSRAARALVTDDDDAVETPEQKDTKADITRKRKLLERSLDRFKLAAEAENEGRRLEIDDLKFDAGEQWPDDIKSERAGKAGPGLLGVPARPCLTINKLDQPILQLTNTQRAAHLAIQISPKGGGATKETAETLQGLIRNIEVESRAQIARGWAFERAVKCGRGWYRIVKTYANDGDFDQDLQIKRILNQASVYADPFAIEPDWSDGEWLFDVVDLPAERFARMFPRSILTQSTESELSSIGDTAPDWIGGDKTSRTFRVAEHYYVETETKTLVQLGTAAGAIGPPVLKDDLPTTLPPGLAIIQERDYDKKTVHYCQLSAAEILKETVWEGRYIPYIPVIGKEYNIDGKRTFAGIVRGAKDAQRSYNVMRSAQVEAVGLAPKSPWVMAEGQDEGFETMWKLANVRNFSSLKYKAISIGGAAVPPPQRNVVEPAIQAITLAAHEADMDIKATTNTFDPSLGNIDPRARSGKAIQALQKQSEQGNSNFIDNLGTISMVHEGRVLLDLIPYVYDREQRVVQLLGLDDEPQHVMLNAPFVPGENGAPLAMMKGPDGAYAMPAGAPGPPAGGPQPKPKHFDLKQGQYGVVVAVGKSFSTRREETVTAVGELIIAAPQLAPLIADLWVAQMDFPQARQMADRLRKALPPGMADETDGPDPRVLEQKVQSMTMQLQMAMTDLAEKTRLLDNEREKLASNERMKAAEIESKERIVIHQVEAQLLAVQAKIDAARADATITAELNAAQQELDLLHQRVLQHTGQAHEAGMQAMGAVHDQQAAVGEQQADAALAAQQAGHDSASMAQQAGHDAQATDQQAAHDAAATDQQAGHAADAQQRQAKIDAAAAKAAPKPTGGP